jgi:ComF family protein
MLRAVADPILSVLYPQECRICSAEVEETRNGIACRDCWSKTRFFTGKEMLCDKCGAFFSETAAPVPIRCHKCDDHKYDKAFAIGVYEKALSANILQLKIEQKMPLRLRDLISTTVKRLAVDIDAIVPVPLSKLRRLERGYNQAELIANIISKELGIPVDRSSLARSSHTPIHRIGMDQRARELTVQKAFAVTRPKFVKDKKLLLVDDVLTSGSTASGCAAVLKKNGASRVDIFTLARAVMN